MGHKTPSRRQEARRRVGEGQPGRRLAWLDSFWLQMAKASAIAISIELANWNGKAGEGGGVAGRGVKGDAA